MTPSLDAAIGVFIAAATLVSTWVTMAVKHGNKTNERMAKIELEMSYMRRDLDQLLRLYHLTPVSEQDRRRHR